MRETDKKLERLTQAAKLYYYENLTQSEIAKRLGVSRPMVSVILSEARALGIVSITVNEVANSRQLLERRLKESFGLKEVLLVPEDKNDDRTNSAVAARAFELCFPRENSYKSVGVGWGSMLGRMAEYAERLEDSKDGGGRIFPLVGGISSVVRGYHTNEIVRIFALKTGKEPDFLYIPALFDSNADLQYTKQTEPYTLINAQWDGMEQAIVSISNFPSYPDLAVKTIYGNRLTERRAVGRMLAYYFDAEGSIISPDADTSLQVSLRQLQRAQVVALCSNQVKPVCVAGALRLGLIDTLVLPYPLAQRVADLSL
ncbi:MAG: sugar-binding domain-containing protein [Oscillospiraceae bacterium]|nr:sugar-binding domain-containing protein [Oscillospiraceae bacterium]